MDEGTGTSVGDSSPYDRTSTVSGAPTWVTGQVGGALRFDGSDDAVVVPDADSLDLTNQMTIATGSSPRRVRPRASSSKAVNGGTNGYELSLATTTAHVADEGLLPAEPGCVGRHIPDQLSNAVPDRRQHVDARRCDVRRHDHAAVCQRRPGRLEGSRRRGGTELHPARHRRPDRPLLPGCDG